MYVADPSIARSSCLPGLCGESAIGSPSCSATSEQRSGSDHRASPGSKVHETGIPWNDASGDRLRDWLQLDRSVFYDKRRVAILPMGLCYPGAGENSGDKPPRPECAPLWHERLLNHLPDLRMTLLVGQYAQRHYLGAARQESMTRTVKAFSMYAPQFFPLPHPSWRSLIWMRKHPWFELAVLPALRKAVRKAV